MKPIFFPHTSIDPALAAALSAIFGPVTLFNPLAEATGQLAALEQARQIELVLPCPDEADMLVAAHEGFKSWAREHKGQDLAALLQQSPVIPFFDANAAARIAAEIRSPAKAPAETTDEDRLQRACLLLLMAQELDARRRELESDFNRLESQERRMLAMLKGEVEVDDATGVESGERSSGAGGSSLHMASARITAWARLALEADAFWRENTETIFLTASPDVYANVRDQVETDDVLAEHLVLPGSDRLSAWLADPQGPPPTSAVPAPNTTPPAFALTVVRLPRLGPLQWLRRLAGERAPASDNHAWRSSTSGFMMGHVQLT